jgi:hypothetical protein
MSTEHPERGPDGRGPEGGRESEGGGVDRIAILYILGGIPAIVVFIVGLFLLVNLFPSIPA